MEAVNYKRKTSPMRGIFKNKFCIFFLIRKHDFIINQFQISQRHNDGKRASFVEVNQTGIFILHLYLSQFHLKFQFSGNINALNVLLSLYNCSSNISKIILHTLVCYYVLLYLLVDERREPRNHVV